MVDEFCLAIRRYRNLLQGSLGYIYLGNLYVFVDQGNQKDFFQSRCLGDVTPYNQLAPSEIDKDFLYAKDDNGNPYSPSWYTLNFRSQYQLSEALLVIATLENITNQRYRTYSSGIAAPGINLILAVKYSL